MTAPRAVLLDIDDTVLDTTTAMITAGQAAMAALWPERDESWHLEAAVRFRNDPGGFFKRFATGELAFEEVRRSRLTEVAEHAGLRLPADAFALYDSVYEPVFKRAQRVFPDVHPFLDRCAHAGVAVGALTNASAVVTADKLAAVDADDWFEVVITRDDLGFGKPDPRVFRHACAAIGVEPGDAVYVGDELVADVHGADCAGLRPVWLRRSVAPGGHARPHQGEGKDVPEGAAAVTDLEELADLLGLGRGADLGSPGRGR